jgi:hypothetical protein
MGLIAESIAVGAASGVVGAVLVYVAPQVLRDQLPLLNSMAQVPMQAAVIIAASALIADSFGRPMLQSALGVIGIRV